MDHNLRPISFHKVWYKCTECGIQLYASEFGNKIDKTYYLFNGNFFEGYKNCNEMLITNIIE